MEVTETNTHVIVNTTYNCTGRKLQEHWYSQMLRAVIARKTRWWKTVIPTSFEGTNITKLYRHLNRPTMRFYGLGGNTTV